MRDISFKHFVFIVAVLPESPSVLLQEKSSSFNSPTFASHVSSDLKLY